MLSKICALIAGVLMFATPVLFVVWLVRIITRKSAKYFGIAALICAVCFVSSVMVGAFSDPNASERIAAVVSEKTEGKNVVPEAETVEETKKSFLLDMEKKQKNSKFRNYNKSR